MEFHVHIAGRKGNNAKYFFQLSCYANGPETMSVYFFFKLSLALGSASVGVSLHACRFVPTACTHSYSNHLHHHLWDSFPPVV